MDASETTAVQPSRRSIAVVAAVCTVAASIVLLAALGDHGLWTDGELPVMARTRAALGAALTNLQRSPWFPDAVRTFAYSLWTSELGIRLPHALAAAALVGCTAGLARWRGAAVPTAVLAGAFVLAFPITQTGGRTLLGNPIGELLGVMTVIVGLAAIEATSRRAAAVLGTVAAAIMVLSVSSSGLLFGGTLPLAAIAVSGRRRVPRAVWAAVLVTAGLTLMLAIRQEDGYVPLLGAAKDLDVLDEPHRRGFTDGLEDLGYQTFPWLPLAAIGALHPGRARWPALWLVIGLAITLPWTVPYGKTALPLSLPIALCCAHAVEQLVGDSGSKVARRLTLLVVLGGMLIMGKDAERTPSRVGAVLVDFIGEHRYPSKELRSTQRLRRINQAALFGLVVIVLLGNPTRGLGKRLHRATPDRIHPWFVPGLMIGVLVHQALVYGHGIVPDSADGFSPKRTLHAWDRWVAAGVLPGDLGIHRVQDEGFDLYGPAPEQRPELNSRSDVIHSLTGESPAAIIIRDSDLAAIHQHHRQHGWPLYVLVTAHVRYMLVSNVLPSDATDLNPIPDVLLDEPPVLANETLVEFDKRVRLIGWELESPVVRGSTRTITLAFEVLRNLPGGAEMHARLQKGRTSRINQRWHELVEGIYPSNYWREGDYLLHRHTFETPTLEIRSGVHELIVALKRGEKSNYPISIPEGKKGELGVRLRGKKREFAVIGHVDVW